jgi:hypothetical protein
MRTQADIGRKQWLAYEETALPMQRELAQRAREYNTEAKREELALQFKAGHEQAVLGRTQSRNRQMASMGVNPNSGRFQGLQRSSDVQDAAMEAAGMNRTRQQAEQFGNALMLDSIGASTGLAGLSQGAYAGALNAGNSAGQNAMAPGNNYMQGLGQGTNTLMQGRQNYMGNMLGMTGQQASIYNNYESPLGAALGMGMQGAALAGGLGWSPFG